MESIYEWEILEDIVFDTLHPKQIIKKPPTISDLNEILETLLTEKDAVPKRIRKRTNKITSSKSKAAYIQLQQAGIIRMMDALIQYLLPKEISDIYETDADINLENIYKKLYIELETILGHIKYNYTKYFDYNSKIPDGHKLKIENDVRQVQTVLQKALRTKVDNAFLELLTEPFTHFVSDETEYSYKELDYLMELKKNLVALSKSIKGNIEEKITERLLYLNFNSVLFFNYYILKIVNEADKRNTVTERVEYFSWQMKVINQTAVKPDVCYLQHLTPIKDQLIFWITEDLYYLNKKHQLSLVLPVNRQVERDKTKRVHVQLTVADLAFGAKLLLDTEVIVNMNYTELMKVVARGFRTNRQANISQQAIYNVGFEASTSSKEKMKQVLMKMIRKIGEY